MEKRESSFADFLKKAKRVGISMGTRVDVHKCSICGEEECVHISFKETQRKPLVKFDFLSFVENPPDPNCVIYIPEKKEEEVTMLLSARVADIASEYHEKMNAFLNASRNTSDTDSKTYFNDMAGGYNAVAQTMLALSVEVAIWESEPFDTKFTGVNIGDKDATE